MLHNRLNLWKYHRKINYYHSSSVSCDTKSNNPPELPNFGAKGQIKPKADWHAVDSPKKRIMEFVLFFAVKSKKKWKIVYTYICIYFGESTARQSAYGFIWPNWSLKYFFKKIIAKDYLYWRSGFVRKAQKNVKQLRNSVRFLCPSKKTWTLVHYVEIH